MKLVAAPMWQQKRRLPLADASEFVGEVDKVVNDEVHDVAFTLNTTADSKHGGGEDCAAMLFEDLGPDDEVGDAGLILQSDKDHALGRARFLPDENEPRRLKPASVACLHGLGAGDDALCPEVGAEKSHRVSA